MNDDRCQTCGQLEVNCDGHSDSRYWEQRTIEEREMEERNCPARYEYLFEDVI